MSDPLDEIAIFLTTYSNLACKMCSYWKKRVHGINHDRILSLLDEARTLGATRFSPWGTEIFMREDTIDILSYAERIGFQEILVVSNGNLLMENQRIDRLEKLRTLCIAFHRTSPGKSMTYTANRRKISTMGCYHIQFVCIIDNVGNI